MPSHASPTQASSRRARLRRLLLALVYFSALAALMFWELRERVDFLAPDCDGIATSPKSALYTQPYRYLLEWTSHDAPGHVSVVAIPSGLEEIQGNQCHARSYMADLLRSVASQDPAEIVIDKFYGPTTCASDPASTAELTSTLQGLPFPVVLGESTNLLPESVDHSCLVRKPQLELAGPNIHHGLTRLNVDTEKLPLVWKVASEGPESSKPTFEMRDSLSWAAVKAYDPAFAARPRIQALVDSDRHPYANIQGDLPQQTSTDLLCYAGTPAMRQRWSVACGPSNQPPKLRGKIVLIGSEDHADRWPVVGAEMWGFDLQAHYIDVLLSGSYLHELSFTAVALTFAAFVFLIEGLPTILIAFRPRWKRKRLLRYAYPRRRYIWVFFSAVACIVISSLVALIFRCLPPLAVLGDIVFVTVTRLLMFAAESSEHPFVHAAKHRTKKGAH